MKIHGKNAEINDIEKIVNYRLLHLLSSELVNFVRNVCIVNLNTSGEKNNYN